ncbi:VOC family protein [Aliivibrio kagoshimensis]|uniref:VOC family protein n=1 Tax=Aliivibrio kagoshimensis TaxID=2910230 RepID=UPI003D09F9DA
MQGNPIGWFEIYVDDIERAKTFYQALLAVTLEKLESPAKVQIEMWAFPGNMESYGATGALVKMDNVKAGGNSTLVYFSCDDCAVEESRSAKNGGTVQVPKMPIGEHGFISVVEDTEGNMIGLHSMK